jgi:hypothetical protein
MVKNNKISDRLNIDLIKLRQWRQNRFPNNKPFLFYLPDLVFKDKATLMQPTFSGVVGRFVLFLKNNRLFYIYEGWWSNATQEIEGRERLLVLNVMLEVIMRKYPNQVPSGPLEKLNLLINKMQEAPANEL